MYCHWRPPDAMPLLTQNVIGASGQQRRNFDGYIYIHCAVPPYSARISTIYLLPFGKVWLGCVCRAQCLATKQNAEFTKGEQKRRSYFKPFVDQSS